MRLDLLGKTLDPESDTPLALQVARAFAQAIQAGELHPGEALPGTRPLAESLGVSRYAVLGALKELELEGFLALRHGSGAYVVDRPPSGLPRAWGGQAAPPPKAVEGPAYDLSSHLAPISSLGAAAFDLSEGFPDPRLAPQGALAKAYQRAVKLHGDELFGVGEPKGNITLRRELARFLRDHRGLSMDPECLLITRGLRNGLDLVLEALFPKGGRLGIESPRAADLWEKVAGHRDVQVVEVPGDAEGVIPEALAQCLAGTQLRALLLRTCSGAPEDGGRPRDQAHTLLPLAANHRLAILEDDSAFPFGGNSLPRLPLAAADQAGAVIYLLSFGKLVAPGIRLGVLAGSRDLVDRLARIRRSTELQGDRVLEWAMADLLRDGDLDRYFRRAALVYSGRAERFIGGLRDRLGAWLQVERTEGLVVWVSGQAGFDLARWVQACRSLGVKLGRPLGDPLQPGGGVPMALGYGTLDDLEQVRVLELLRQAAERA